MARIDKQKRAWGGAIKRTKPSEAALIVAKHLKGRILDFGCGYGFDADHFGWDSYDPYYRPQKPSGKYDSIICTGVINALSRNNRTKVLKEIQELLTKQGTAYLIVPRNIPLTGKLGIHHSLQNYVNLTLASFYCDFKLEIYLMTKSSVFKDKTIEYMTLRDKRTKH